MHTLSCNGSSLPPLKATICMYGNTSRAVPCHDSFKNVDIKALQRRVGRGGEESGRGGEWWGGERKGLKGFWGGNVVQKE